jgi:DNA-binding beta-propeller fold protein YncE
MTSGFNHSAGRRHFRALNFGFVFLLFGGTLAHAADIIYVSNTGAGTISEINLSGNESTFASGLNSPEGLAFDNAGNLYVADSGDGTISQINPAGNVMTYASGLNSPAAVACDPSGNIYVANPTSGTISKINSSGNVSVFASGLIFNTDGAQLASDNAGNIYANIHQNYDYTVTRFDSNANQTILAQTPGYIEGIAVNGNGNFYYGNENSDFIAGNGGLQTSSLDYPAPYNNEMAAFADAPVDLAFDANGNLFVTFSGLVDPGSSPIDGDSVSDTLVEFGVNGVNSIIASNIGGYEIAVQEIAVQTVPEPSSLALLSIGLAIPFYFIHRRKTNTTH